MTKGRMKRILGFLMVVAAGVVLFVSQAAAQSSNAGGQTTGQAGVQPDVQSPPPAVLPPQASPQANVALEAAKKKGRNAPAGEVEKTEKSLRESVKSVEVEASTKGDMVVAQRFGEEFGMTPDALVSERGQFKTGWGDLMIAHTLLANAKSTLTTEQVFQMRTEGMGWGQIAHGLDLKLGDVVSAVQAETRVATGLAKPDGKTATIHTASVKAGSAKKADAAAGKSAPAGKEEVGAGSSSKVGVGATETRGHSGK